MTCPKCNLENIDPFIYEPEVRCVYCGGLIYKESYMWNPAVVLEVMERLKKDD